MSAARPSPSPQLGRRRALGAASARSLLLTVLGEFVLPRGGPVWTSAFIDALAAVGVEEKAARQALARSASDGWVSAHRVGRRTAWTLTPETEQMLRDGASRIYGFGDASPPWDGRWLLTLLSVPEANRRLRHQVRARLAWEGMGSLSAGTWVSPHPERESRVEAVLGDLGLGEAAIVFVGRLARLGSAERIARTAWDLDELAGRYRLFVERVSSTVADTPRDAFAWQVRLVQEWRRFPLLDPKLPVELLPPDWVGAEAARLFAERHAAWRPPADEFWLSLA